MKTIQSDPIAPTIETGNNGEVSQGFGLTKREYFAAMAMSSMSVNGVMIENGNIVNDPETIALMAVKYSDALINALNK